MHDTLIQATRRATDAGIDAARARLAADVEAAASLPGIDAAALGALRRKLAGSIFNLVVAGEFKRGKSSVVNALLGADVLPTGVIPLTSMVTVLRHGTAPAVEVSFEDGRHASFGPEALADYVTERGNPRNAKRVREVEVAWPAPWLGRGFRLADTPGIGSAYGHNTDVTRAYLPNADAVIFVASVEQPVSRSELQFLSDIRACADRIFCLLNKTDYLSPQELAESVAFSTAALREALGTEVPVFPVSARRALQARASGAGDAFAASGFADFDAALQSFLARDSGAVWIESIQHHMTRLLSECRLSAELELKALAAPLESLREKLQAFAARRDETLRARDDFDALLAADTRKLVRQQVEPGLLAFKQDLLARLHAAVPGWLEQAGAKSGLSRQAALEERIVAEVRHAFDAWRAQEDADVDKAFEQICERFRSQLQQQVDALLRYSAELFSVPFHAVATPPLRDARSRFHYKFWQEPPSLRLLSDAAAGLLPGALGRAVLLKRARVRVAELVEMQSGRLRHDYEQRITEAMRLVRRELLDRMQTTIASIEAAIAAGRDLRARGEDTVAAHQQDIAARLARIDALSAHTLAAG